MSQPKISIIIPVYNVEKSISKCAASLFSQTICQDLEFIFIDDASPDNSIKILNEVIHKFALTDKQVQIIRNTENRGLAKTRIIGLEHAKADYIGFCDSDDWVEPNMYEKLYDKLRGEDADLVICGYSLEGLKNKKIQPVWTKDPLKDLLRQTVPVSMWSRLFRKDLFDLKSLIVPPENMGEDLLFNVQLTLNAKKVCHINESLYHYDINVTSISNSVDANSVRKKVVGLKRNINEIESILREKDLLRQYRNEILQRKVNIRLLIYPILETPEGQKIWRELDVKIPISKIFMNSIPLRDKVVFILFQSRLGRRIYRFLLRK